MGASCMRPQDDLTGGRNANPRRDNKRLFNIVMAEYIWLGGDLEIRGKTKCIHNCAGIQTVDELPTPWNFDGSSTKQATGDNSEVFLKPVKVVPDPFRGNPHVIVLCETYADLDLTKPNRTNFRYFAKQIFDAKRDEHPWFGIEQEYCIMSLQGQKPWPLGFPKHGYPSPQGPYYCSVGGENAVGRKFSDAVLFHCLEAGLTVSGTNAEVMCGQWEIQLGPCLGIDMGDQLWVMRYIMNRLAEAMKVKVELHPKPVKGDWNGSGCHTNYSNKSSRNDKNCTAIRKQLENMGQNHDKCILFYGKENYDRLTGKHETSSIREFSYGVANRGCSVRIPRTTDRDGYGYYEDRRPSSDIDPYTVTAAIFDTSMFGGSKRLDQMIEAAKANIPNQLLTKAKIDHMLEIKEEEI